MLLEIAIKSRAIWQLNQQPRANYDYEFNLKKQNQQTTKDPKYTVVGKKQSSSIVKLMKI